MNTKTVVDIAATPEQVFACLNDPELGHRWITGLVEHEELEQKDEMVGSRFRQVYLENGRRIESTGQVTEYVPNERLAICVNGPRFLVDVLYLIVPTADGVRLTQDAAVEFQGLMRILMWIINPFIKKAGSARAAEDLAKFKALCESA